MGAGEESCVVDRASVVYGLDEGVLFFGDCGVVGVE